MFEINKIYRQSVGRLRFVGKKYENADRANGTFGVKSKWDEWFENGWFEAIESKINGNPGDTCEDGGAYIGLMRNKSGEHQYWIGMFTPENTEIPEGFEYIDFPESELDVCWVCGKAEHVRMNEGIELFERCNERLKKEGMSHVHDKENVCYTFERYALPRSAEPDEKGNIILDICFYMRFQYEA